MALPVQSASTSADEVQVRLLRGAGTAGRFERARSLSAAVIALSRMAIRRRHPDWSERDVLLEFVRVSYGSDLAVRMRRDLDRRDR